MFRTVVGCVFFLVAIRLLARIKSREAKVDSRTVHRVAPIVPSARAIEIKRILIIIFVYLYVYVRWRQ